MILIQQETGLKENNATRHYSREGWKRAVLHFEPAQIFLCYSKPVTSLASAISFLPHAAMVPQCHGATAHVQAGVRLQKDKLEAAQLTDLWPWGLAFAITNGQVTCLGKKKYESKNSEKTLKWGCFAAIFQLFFGFCL